MFDALSESLRAVSARSAAAPALVFAAGALSSVGPCVAPRFIAIAGIVARSSGADRLRLVALFCSGLTAAYASFGGASALLGGSLRYSQWIYGVLAVALGCAGLATLWREGEACRRLERRAPRSAGGVFLLGASFAFVISPCCTPLVAGILAYTSAASDPGYGAALLAVFALGHMLPLFAAAIGAGRVTDALGRIVDGAAAGVVGGSLLLALAGYYAVLA